MAEETDQTPATADTPVRWRRPAIGLGIVAGLLTIVMSFFAGCTSWDPRRPFERNAPEVDAAIAAMEAEQPQRAVGLLQAYLQTGPCSEEGIGLPDAVRDKYDASFDLGLALFQLAESYGQRFGDEPMPSPSAMGFPGAPPGQPPNTPPADPEQEEKREQTVACARAIVNAIASDPELPIDLRARAFYLEGNLRFIQGEYEEAVTSYDLALTLLPGFPEPKEGEAAEGAPKDTIGADAAWNRSIALWRQQEVEKHEPPPPEPKPDENQSENEPQNGDQPQDNGDGQNGDKGKGDKGKDGDDKDGKDDQNKDEPDPGEEDEDEKQNEPKADGQQERADKGADEGIDESGDEKGAMAAVEALLDDFESAPTYQGKAAEKRANNVRRRRVMEDK